MGELAGFFLLLIFDEAFPGHGSGFCTLKVSSAVWSWVPQKDPIYVQCTFKEQPVWALHAGNRYTSTTDIVELHPSPFLNGIRWELRIGIPGPEISFT